MKRADERRQQTRAQIDTEVDETVYGGQEYARTVDISEGGIRYFKPAGKPRPAGEKVFLEFCLPGDWDPIRALGQVAGEWGDTLFQSTSVSFEFIKPSDARRIRAFIKRKQAA